MESTQTEIIKSNFSSGTLVVPWIGVFLSTVLLLGNLVHAVALRVCTPKVSSSSGLGSTLRADCSNERINSITNLLTNINQFSMAFFILIWLALTVISEILLIKAFSKKVLLKKDFIIVQLLLVSPLLYFIVWAISAEF